MSNLWSYDKPTEPGWYWANRGDVVTNHSLCCEEFSYWGGTHLSDSHSIEVAKYVGVWKFLKVDIDALNALGNE